MNLDPKFYSENNDFPPIVGNKIIESILRNNPEK